jgi:hypothetical protein
MSLLIDRQYANYMNTRLGQFRWIRPELAHADCPFCSDTRHRFFIYKNTKKNSVDYLSTMCHNCGYSATFYNFLKAFDPSMFDEYRMETFKEKFNHTNKPKQEQYVPPAPEKKLTHLFNRVIPSTCVYIKSLDETHLAYIAMKKRMLPDWFFNELWYTDNFNDLVLEVRPEMKDTLGFAEPRVVIPFYDIDKKLMMFQGRSMKANSMAKYLSIKLDDSINKIYGLDRLDIKKDVYVVEGPIDSAFIDNCLATADANLLNSIKYVDDPILIPDYQYRNSAICNQIEKFINAGYRVVLFPSNHKWKDINDCVKDGGMSQKDVMQLIQTNTFRGLAAQFHFGNLRKDKNKLRSNY